MEQTVPHELAVSSDDCGRSSDTKTRTMETKEECDRGSKRKKLDTEHEISPTVSQLGTSHSAATCAFCHSFRISEVSGPMLHYDGNGEPLEEEEPDQTISIHVHDQCIGWAPQVYFDGETAINLKAELSRAAKLKCCSCGQKGAALGCYYKTCRRSYHVPCVFKIPDCRLDTENFHVLCPKHSSKELPCDISKSQKKNKADCTSPAQLDCSDALPETALPIESREECWTAAPHLTSIWILCGSDLSTDEKDLLDKFTTLTGTTVTEQWKPDVTHVIASTDKSGACSRTFKVLMATLSGQWVLPIDWIKACTEAKHPLEEEQYEIGLDIHGCVDGPKKGRLRAASKGPKIFAGLDFYFIGLFTGPLKGFTDKLVVAAGGTILNRDNFLSKRDSEAGGSSPTSYVVYNEEPPEECNSIDFDEVLQKRSEEAVAFAATTCARVISHSWIFDAIANSSLEFSQKNVHGCDANNVRT